MSHGTIITIIALPAVMQAVCAEVGLTDAEGLLVASIEHQGRGKTLKNAERLWDKEPAFDADGAVTNGAVLLPMSAYRLRIQPHNQRPPPDEDAQAAIAASATPETFEEEFGLDEGETAPDSVFGRLKDACRRMGISYIYTVQALWLTQGTEDAFSGYAGRYVRNGQAMKSLNGLSLVVD
ncbi:MAG: hypothetical protein JJ894_03115 [Dinoroseobacter sp.]|nr:hypothetical protein [Dinoroseobacter sp.]